MNKKVLILALSLLLFAAVAPVMAEPTKGQKVPASCYTVGIAGMESGRSWTTGGGILQWRESQEDFLFVLIIGDDTFTGYSSNVYDGMAHTDVTRPHIGDVVEHFDAVWTIDGADGGFEGNIKLKIFNYNPFVYPPTFDYLVVHCVLQGFGDFEGQTLMLSYEGTEMFGPGAAWTGYCLKG